MHVRLHVTVVEVRPGVLGDELVGEALARLDRRLGDVRHAVGRVGVNGAVQMDGVRKVVGVAQHDAHAIALLDADRGARHPRRRDHPAGLRREHPEGDELAGVDLLLRLGDLKDDLDLVRVAVAIDIAAQRDRFGRHAGNCRRRLRARCRRHEHSEDEGREVKARTEDGHAGRLHRGSGPKSTGPGASVKIYAAARSTASENAARPKP